MNVLGRGGYDVTSCLAPRRLQDEWPRAWIVGSHFKKRLWIVIIQIEYLIPDEIVYPWDWESAFPPTLTAS